MLKSKGSAIQKFFSGLNCPYLASVDDRCYLIPIAWWLKKPRQPLSTWKKFKITYSNSLYCSPHVENVGRDDQISWLKRECQVMEDFSDKMKPYLMQPVPLERITNLRVHALGELLSCVKWTIRNVWNPSDSRGSLLEKALRLAGVCYADDQLPPQVICGWRHYIICYWLALGCAEPYRTDRTLTFVTCSKTPNPLV